jgi:Flp pilus assembly protein TadD
LDDIVGGGAGGWTLDPSARHAMLLDAARTALQRGDHVSAVILAEELLDDAPDDTDALLVVAEAAPVYGHGEVGALAAAQAGRRGADIGSLEAFALFSACEVDRALVSADAAITRRAEDARAHLVRGLALECNGRVAESEAAFARAAELDPEAYPAAVPAPADAPPTAPSA